MIENTWFIAAFWMGLAVLASLISIRLGATRVSDHAHCSVLMVKGPEKQV